MAHPVIFTDLDGTLLDSPSGSIDEIRPALRLIRDLGIPMVICSSKTAAEIRYLRRTLENRDPFVSENGGGLFVPQGYFSFAVRDHRFDDTVISSVIVQQAGDCELVRLGSPYEDAKRIVRRLRQEGFPVKGFGDMSTDEISEATGLSLDEARMAQERDFDEPFVFEGDQTRERDLAKAVEDMGFRYLPGRFGHIVGNSDKGRAVSLLTSMYRTDLEDVVTIGVGDAPNDIPMLRVVDHPIAIRRRDGSYHPDMKMEGLILAGGAGPTGWSRALMDLLGRMRPSGPFDRASQRA